LDKSIKLWSLEDGSLLHDMGFMKSQVTSISLNPVSEISFCATSFDGTLWIFENMSKPPKIVPGNSLQAKTNWTLTACWSNCGSKIYIGRRNEEVDTVDVAKATITSSIRLLQGSGWITSLVMFPNNRHLLICSHDTLRLWDLEFTISEESQDDGSEQVAFSTISGNNSAMISSAILSHSGGLLVTVSGSRGYEGFNASNQLVLYELFPRFNNYV
jgi:transcriptional activator SPT8